MTTIKLTHTRVFKTLWNEQKRINAFRGSARSSKTWSILQAIMYWLITGYFGKLHVPRGNFSVVRETLPSLRASAYADFIELLHLARFYSRIEHRKTSLELHYQGRHVDFFSTDDLNSAKLRGRQHSFFFINEANTVSFEAFNQLIMRTENFCILDYNPAGVENFCKTYIEGTRYERGDVALDVSTYHDNKYIPLEMVQEIEGLKLTDSDLYKCYALGIWIDGRNKVYEDITLVEEMPQDFDRVWFGCDFGWIDPTVCVEVGIIGKDLFINQLFYKSKMTHEAISEELFYYGVKKAYCDNSPRMINNLKRLGNRVRPAKKGPDSILEGIRFIQKHRIHITKDSIETIAEFRKYSWKLDKEQKPTDTPADAFNHSCDAVRYALSFAQRPKLRFR